MEKEERKWREGKRYKRKRKIGEKKTERKIRKKQSFKFNY